MIQHLQVPDFSQSCYGKLQKLFKNQTPYPIFFMNKVEFLQSDLSFVAGFRIRMLRLINLSKGALPDFLKKPIVTKVVVLRIENRMVY